MAKSKKQKVDSKDKNKKKKSNTGKVVAGVAVGAAAGAVLGYKGAKIVSATAPKLTARMVGAGLKTVLAGSAKIARGCEKVVEKFGGLKAKIAAKAATKEVPEIIVKEGSKELATKIVAKEGTKEVATKLVAKEGSKELATKIAAKEAEKISPKLVTKVGTETVAKTGSKLVSKELAKCIPFVSLGIGALFAAGRAMKGDFTGAALELSSGALACVPLVGTAGSLGLDAAIIARDLKRR